VVHVLNFNFAHVILLVCLMCFILFLFICYVAGTSEPAATGDRAVKEHNAVTANESAYYALFASNALYLVSAQQRVVLSAFLNSS
jgi:hypothetical protein